jgi:DNA-binding Lrp family transcriptional regulator
MKLDTSDERVLALLGTRRRSLSALASDLDASCDELRKVLAELADNGLVERCESDRYRRTESGRRVLVTSAATDLDERLDTSPEVEAVLDEFDLRADEVDAVRHAYTFLRYWGQVSEEELIDGVYSEADAGRTSPAEWWEGLVRDALAALPDVAAPSDETTVWRCTSPPESGDSTANGRRVLSRTHPVYGDVKHALESLGLSDEEREAARAAFRHLYRSGDATESEICETVFPAFTAGYDDSDAWWDEVVEAAFRALPGVERAERDRWRYRVPRRPD